MCVDLYRKEKGKQNVGVNFYFKQSRRIHVIIAGVFLPPKLEVEAVIAQLSMIVPVFSIFILQAT